MARSWRLLHNTFQIAYSNSTEGRRLSARGRNKIYGMNTRCEEKIFKLDFSIRVCDDGENVQRRLFRHRGSTDSFQTAKTIRNSFNI